MGPVSTGPITLCPMTLEMWPSPVPIAHRGSRYLWPENTMEAFSGAIFTGYRHVETDLHQTSDGVLVLVHDDTVDRTTDATGRVSDYTFAELAELDAGYRHGAGRSHEFRGQGLRIPSLEELLVTYPDIGVVADLKAPGLAVPLRELIDRLGAHERLIVGSFDDRRLDEFREVTRGRVATSTGTGLSRAWYAASRIGRAPSGEASALQLPRTRRGLTVVDRRLVETAHAQGVQVHVWTINDPAEMIELLDLGVDGLVTDRPDLLKTVLVERGEWRG